MTLDPDRLRKGKPKPRNREPRVYDLLDVLDFGKHKGRTVQSVLEENARYIQWCLEEIPWFSITKRADESMEDWINQQDSEDNENYDDDWRD